MMRPPLQVGCVAILLIYRLAQGPEFSLKWGGEDPYQIIGIAPGHSKGASS
jgi:hypothetical protein